MKTLYIVFFLLTSLAQAKEDPCKLDYKNSDCSFKVRYYLFQQYNMDGTPGGDEYFTYINDYYDKYGIEGFTYSENGEKTLLEYAFKNNENESLKKRLLHDFPKGKVIDGKNIFQLILPWSVFTSRDSLDNYIFSLNNLFPEHDNEGLKKTQKLYGIPWDDPSFMHGYLNTMKTTVEDINKKNNFFKREELIEQRDAIQKIIDRLTPFAKIADEICTYTTLEQIEEAKLKFPDLFSSSQKNVVGCLLKKGECEIASFLINSGDYPIDRLAEYFDTIIHLKSSKACVETLKIVYTSMLINGKPITSSDKYSSVLVLKKINSYYQKYQFDEQVICESNPWIHFNNLDDFTNNLKKVIAYEGRDLMTQILAQQDAAKKKDLVDQFIDFYRLNVEIPTVDPKTDKTMLHQIIDAEDFELFDELIQKHVDPYALGLLADNKIGVDPLDYAIASGEFEKIKFAQRLYEVSYKDAGYMLYVKSKLKKVKTKDEKVKAYIKSFINSIKSDISHEY